MPERPDLAEQARALVASWPPVPDRILAEVAAIFASARRPDGGVTA
jgi:hypothetical protein